jgi:dTMP kinase
MSGMLITIEGIDGAGKSSVINEVRNSTELTQQSPEVYFTSEPKSGTWLGDDVVRKAINGKHKDLSPVSIFFLFLAEHASHVDSYIQPQLEQGKTVICDRYVDSRYVYQGYELEQSISGNTLSWIKSIQEQGWSRMPDLTILLDVSVQTALTRLTGDEIFEREDKLREYRKRYQALAREEERYVIVDAEQDLESVIQDCFEYIL